MKSTVKQIFYGIFAMILVMFLDSVYRWGNTESLVLFYQCDRNFYLGGFTLFIMVMFNKLCSTLKETHKTFALNKDFLKQRGHTMDFIETVVKDAENAKQKNEELISEIEKLKAELDSAKTMIFEIENNKKAYATLKYKYEALRANSTVIKNK